MESYNPYHEIAHPHVFIGSAFRLKDRELTIETLDYPDTYFVKWFTHGGVFQFQSTMYSQL
ncbi:hypothetical protein J1N35_002307 [Gossypium stocksii]|uniref:Uncharacterized protein n=1 Tax=Gossypium stocksii TaxID=47602 RepID=A0A9D3WKR4_9ROSI|nr:hypothetical protein J1N35_002307 [Gossypium stocksii]